VNPSNTKPFLARLDLKTYANLKKFARQKKVPMIQIVKEALNGRLSVGDKYTAGFNDGVHRSIAVVAGSKWAQMRFPSGKSFAEQVEQDLEAQLIPEGKNDSS
jgi:hypothetical protein